MGLEFKPQALNPNRKQAPKKLGNSPVCPGASSGHAAPGDDDDDDDDDDDVNDEHGADDTYPDGDRHGCATIVKKGKTLS